MNSVLRDRFRADRNTALRNLAGGAFALLASGIVLWLFVPALGGLGPGFTAAGAVLALGIPMMLMARALRVGRHARREGAFLTLLDADEISARGTTAMNEIFTRMDSAVSPEASMTAVFFDDRRTGMMTLTVTGLTDGAVTVHKLPAGSARTIVRHFCGAFPPTLPWQAYLLCLPRRGAVVRHLMLDASEAKALGISAVDPADTAAMTKLHHLPL